MRQPPLRRRILTLSQICGAVIAAMSLRRRILQLWLLAVRL